MSHGRRGQSDAGHNDLLALAVIWICNDRGQNRKCRTLSWGWMGVLGKGTNGNLFLIYAKHSDWSLPKASSPSNSHIILIPGTVIEIEF